MDEENEDGQGAELDLQELGDLFGVPMVTWYHEAGAMEEDGEENQDYEDEAMEEYLEQIAEGMSDYGDEDGDVYEGEEYDLEDMDEID